MAGQGGLTGKARSGKRSSDFEAIFLEIIPNLFHKSSDLKSASVFRARLWREMKPERNKQLCIRLPGGSKSLGP